MIHNKKLQLFFFISIFILFSNTLLLVFLVFPKFHHFHMQNFESMAIIHAKSLVKHLSLKNNNFSNKQVFDQQKKDIAQFLNDFNIKKIIFFNKNGEIFYSTDEKDIGRKTERDFFYNLVSKENIFSKTTQKFSNSKNDPNKVLNMVEVYIPLFSHANSNSDSSNVSVDNKGEQTEFVGAFEIYQDIEKEKTTLEQLIFNSNLISILIFVLSLISAFFLFKKIEKTIALERKVIEEQKEIERLKILLEISRATAHELSQPLQVINGYASIIKLNNDLQESDKENFDKIIFETNRIRDLIEKMKNFHEYKTTEYLDGKRMIELRDK